MNTNKISFGTISQILVGIVALGSFVWIVATSKDVGIEKWYFLTFFFIILVLAILGIQIYNISMDLKQISDEISELKK